MSNSIWKTPDIKPEDDQHILFFAGGGRFPYLGFYSQTFDLFEDWKSRDVQRWASVFEVIAQVDKAERLQKAVDLAIRGLEKVHRANSCITKESQIAYEHLKEIKQLIKGE